jgi:hypothetical protein
MNPLATVALVAKLMRSRSSEPELERATPLLIPIISPLAFNKGPPEFPGFKVTSDCKSPLGKILTSFPWVTTPA